ncbi:MAG: AbrB/MazE/SpoVT family DNA-binding domain-containing protein [Planctomycetia bacterium]|nr:AbrB/MazE/SpoVT family DNA-binding domain-containing protein [Planctomycetia bacterium]
MRTRVRAWRRGLAVPIPKSLATKVGLHEGSSVRVSLADGAIIVLPTSRKGMTLSSLLSRVTKENCHGEIDFGRRVGREAW